MSQEDTEPIKHKNLAQAVIAVMKEVKGMEKNSRVGTGNMAYDGTKDQDVKEIFNEKLAKHGLCILPTDIEEETQIDRWEEEQQWSGKTTIKQKQSVFTKVKTKYILMHESGQERVLSGYGHGVDTQDKGAGKATTYALKNCLLYTFLTPVGKIDDTDETHSENIVKAPSKSQKDKTQINRDLNRALASIKASNSLNELKENWKKIGKDLQANKQVVELKDAKKKEFENQ